MHTRGRLVSLTVMLMGARLAVAGDYVLTVTPDRVFPGGPVIVSWSAPAGGVSANDWIGLFTPSAPNTQYITYQYTGGGLTGQLDFDAPTIVGQYEFRYLLQGGYVHAAVSNRLEVACFTANPGPGPKVLLLLGGDQGSDCALASALNDRGLNVTLGPTVPSWDGTQADLSEFDVVVLPHNANWPAPLQETGIAAITEFVEEGGGLVTGEWALWGAFSRAQTSFLALAPVEEYCGYNYATATTYTRATFDPVIHDGLPVSFGYAMTSFGGMESCFGARPGATVFFTSSNGGGRADADGLIGWSYGRGHVASFSTLLSSVELASDDLARLVGNTVIWASQADCSAAEATPANYPDFVDCLSGPGVVFQAGCETQDLNCSGRVDLRDVAFLQRTFDVP